MTEETFSNYAECDSGKCPARIRAYFRKGELILGFCHHHFLKHEHALKTNKWEVSAQDKELQDTR